MTNNEKNILAFLEHHPVFTLDELREFLGSEKGSRKTSDLLLHHKKMGRIGVVKEGLYFAVRPGTAAQHTTPDPFLIASKLVQDAVLSFHTALDLLGYSHSLFNTYYFFSSRYRPAMRFRENHFRSVLTPEQLQKNSQELFGTEKVERLGLKVLVTGKERTLAEALERPQHCGGFEEMYRSLEKIPYVQTDTILSYLQLREQKKLYAAVGFFLEQHRDHFNVEEPFLRQLERHKPSQPVYWDRSKKGGVLVKRWNLVVRKAIVERTWEEF